MIIALTGQLSCSLCYNAVMDLKEERWLTWFLVVFFLLVISVPFLIAQFTINNEFTFGGFLFNPIDGTSYLAKMRQGFDGEWLFRLPYTAEPGEGAPINLIYLFLGHVAKATGWSLLFTFHAVRMLGALLLALALLRLFRRCFDKPGERILAFGLTLFGSGLGWLAIMFGGFTSDFWVAEAIPFLSAYANPHFALGLAMQVWLLTPRRVDTGRRWPQLALSGGVAALLSVVYPFGWAAASAVYWSWLGWLAYKKQLRRADLVHGLVIVLAGLPYSIYGFLLIRAHPLLAQWDAQNLIPSPPLLDLMVAFSPTLVFAVWGAFTKFKGQRAVRYLTVWLLAGIIILYLPINLQRRLITGLYIPVSGLAAVGVSQIPWRTSQKRYLALALFILSLPTNAIVVAGGFQAASNNHPLLVINSRELTAFEWLDANVPQSSLVLASPATGLLLAPYAGVRVIYGHPLETALATQREQELQAFFSTTWAQGEAQDYLQRWGVDYIYYGPSERALGQLPEIPGWQAVYETKDVLILASAP